jgi:hypothetical protein
MAMTARGLPSGATICATSAFRRQRAARAWPRCHRGLQPLVVVAVVLVSQL